MWTVIIIIAVCFIGKFVLDSINQSNDMKAQGGVRTKYAHLIQSLLDSDPRARILQETNTFVNVGISGPAGAQSFFLQQTFGAHPTNPVEGCADANPKTMLPNDT